MRFDGDDKDVAAAAQGDRRSTRSGLIQGAVGFSSRALIQICLLGVTVVATRWLSVVEFGSYAIAAAFMFLFRRLFYVGPYEYMMKTASFPTLNGSCLAANSVFAILTVLAAVGIAALSQVVFGTMLVGEILLILAPSLFITMWTSWLEAHLLKANRIRQYYSFTVLAEIIGSAATVFALLTGYGVFSLACQIYGRLGVLLLCYLANLPGRIWDGYNLEQTAKILAWSKSRYATVCVNFFSVYGADLMLGAALSPVATGMYRAGSRIVSAMTDLFVQPLQKIAQTNLSARAVRGLPTDQSWLGMFSAVGAVAWASLAGLASMADDLVPVVLGEHWRAAAPIVIVMCAVRALPILDATTTSFLVCSDRHRFIFNVQAVTAGVVLIVGFLVAHRGPLAVAAALGLVMVVQSAIYCREATRLSGVHLNALVKALGIAMTPAACVIISIRLFYSLVPAIDSVLLRLLALTAVGALGAVIGLLIVRRPILRSARMLAPLRNAKPEIA